MSAPADFLAPARGSAGGGGAADADVKACPNEDAMLLTLTARGCRGVVRLGGAAGAALAALDVPEVAVASGVTGALFPFPFS